MTAPTANAITLHKYLAACWASKGRDPFSACHEARVAQIENGADLTDAERSGDSVAVMAECAGGSEQ